MAEEKDKNSKPDELEILKAEIEKIKKERDEYLDGWKRAKADYLNYKKEEVVRFGEMVKFSNAAIIEELVGVLDSFDLGLTVLKGDDPARKGFQLIQNQLEDLMKKYGLEKIPASVGQAFDPSRHEAIAEVEAQAPPGMIAEEAEKGYLLNGKVIRPTRVKISKGQIATDNK